MWTGKQTFGKKHPTWEEPKTQQKFSKFWKNLKYHNWQKKEEEEGERKRDGGGREGGSEGKKTMSLVNQLERIQLDKKRHGKYKVESCIDMC